MVVFGKPENIALVSNRFNAARSVSGFPSTDCYRFRYQVNRWNIFSAKHIVTFVRILAETLSSHAAFLLLIYQT
jgi:hypothetical protein